ncbi:MAG: CaiB/BaiF CoA transferase family protein [Methyloligellaceae bacterium]
MTEQKQSKPLSGVRVVDLTRILAGPFCTMNLGDMGAEIVKIERPKSGDDTRGWGPPFVGSEAAYYLGVNRNKLSVTLDLKHERGQKILRDLLKKSDVLIENFKSGTLEKWGLDENWFRENAPHIVHCQITGYGDQGPKGGMPGYDFLLQAESGLMSITGEEQGEPMKLGVAIVDICTGLYAGMTILAALNARHQTGQGQKIALSLFNTSISMLANVASNVLASGEDAERYGNGHPNIVPYRAFACRSGDLALAVGNDLQFARLSNVLGHPEWASDDRFQTNANRVRNRKIIDDLIQKVFSEHDVDYWIEVLNKKGIPCSKINSVKEALDHEQTKANKMLVQLDHNTVGSINLIAAPYLFSSFKAAEDRPPPVLGQDTESVLTELLNLNSDEISELRSLEVID